MTLRIFHRARSPLALVGSLFLTCGVAMGDTLISNLAEPDRDHTAIGNNPNTVPPPGNNPEWNWAAQSFTTDTGTYTLDGIEAWAGDATSTPVPVAFAEIHADNAGTIDALITDFIVPDLSGALSARTCTPTSAVLLQPNTTYWFIMGVEAPGDGGFLWTYADTNGSTGPGSIGAFAFSPDSGALWSYGTDFPWKIAVNVTPAPADSDGDGVPDGDDQCPNTRPGSVVDANGRPCGDFDADCDVDLGDFAKFALNFTGPL